MRVEQFRASRNFGEYVGKHPAGMAKLEFNCGAHATRYGAKQAVQLSLGTGQGVNVLHAARKETEDLI